MSILLNAKINHFMWGLLQILKRESMSTTQEKVVTILNTESPLSFYSMKNIRTAVQHLKESWRLKNSAGRRSLI